MELSKLYQAILASLNVVADDDGLLSLVYGDRSFPATVEGKRLVLPTQKILSDGLGDKLIAFHPLSENVLRGESPVLKKFKTYVTTRLNYVLSELFMAFVEISADHKRHAKLTPDQKELLLAMPDADERSVDDLGKIFEAMQDDNRRKMLTVYLKRGGKLRLEKFSRTAVVNFPIITEFENENRTIYGVKCRVKDFGGYAKLFEYILPNADGTGYSVGSNDKDVPYFDALVQAFVKVAIQLNKRVSQFKKHLPNADLLTIDLSWLDKVTDWSAYRNHIPPLAGNDGATVAEEAASQAEEATQMTRAPVFDPQRAAAAAASSHATHAAPVPHAAAMHAAAPAPAPEIRKTSGGINWQDVVASQQRRSLQPVAPLPTPTAVPYGYQPSVNTGYPMPGYPAPNPGMPMMAYEAPPPGFGPPGNPAPPPVPVDAYGRPMVAMGYPNMGGQGPVMYDPWGRPLAPAAMPPGFGAPPIDPRLQGAGQVGGRQPSFGVAPTFYGAPAGYANVGYPNAGYPPNPAATWSPPPLNSLAQGSAGIPVYRS